MQYYISPDLKTKQKILFIIIFVQSGKYLIRWGSHIGGNYVTSRV